MQLALDVDALAHRLIDDFSRTVLQGAVQVARDADNPIRGNLFAAAIRELLSHILHELAPDEEVKECSWFHSETDDGRPTRAQRQRYVIQGGLSDGYVKRELNLDVDDLRQQLAATVSKLNKATHLREKTVISDAAAMEALVRDSFGALLAMLDAIDHCRLEMMMAVTEQVTDEATEEVLRDSIQTIDELATHHSSKKFM